MNLTKRFNIIATAILFALFFVFPAAAFADDDSRDSANNTLEFCSSDETEFTTQDTANSDVIETAAQNEPTVEYASHVEDYGWLPAEKNGEIGGTTGEAKRMEAIAISIADNSLAGGVEYRSHVQDYGWETQYVHDGNVSGTTGEAKRLEAVQIKLYGALETSYDIWYSVHIADYGWLGWASNGNSAGSSGMSKRLEAIRIKILAKDTSFDAGGLAYLSPVLTANAHVQNIGWQDNSTVSPYESVTIGTTGQALAVEAVSLSLGSEYASSSAVSYNMHLANIGWQYDVADSSSWPSNSAVSGTTGQSRPAEAFQAKLTGTAAAQYELYYRTHSQDIGWLDWTSNGEMAGTVGMAKQLEAIEFAVLPKGAAAPGATAHPFIDTTSIKSISATINAGTSEVVLQATSIDGQPYLFLPSFANTNSIKLAFTRADNSIEALVSASSTGETTLVNANTTLNLDSIGCTADSNGTRKLYYRPNSSISSSLLIIMQSQNISSMFLTSDDPVNKGREYVEASSDHSAKATGTMLMARTDGSTVYNGALKQIRGRGNSTWSASKKPYQIKLSDKADLLDTGVKDESNKTWVLLANQYDSTLIQNQIAFDFARELGLAYTSHCAPVDLFYDGYYRGSYLLCEKIEDGKGRVEVGDDGWLVELDEGYWSTEDPGYVFDTTLGHFVIKNDDVTQSQRDSLQAHFQTALDALTNGLTSSFDMLSAARMAIINELFANDDYIVHSSTYFYTYGLDGAIYAGPAWDFDDCFGHDRSLPTPQGYLIYNSVPYRQDAEFISKTKSEYAVVYKYVKDILLGNADAHGSSLHSVDYYADRIHRSQLMNQVLWNLGQSGVWIINVKETYQENIDFLKSFIRERNEWLASSIAQW